MGISNTSMTQSMVSKSCLGRDGIQAWVRKRLRNMLMRLVSGSQMDFKTLLGMMNGTNIPTLNVYGGSNEPTREGIGAYSYPRDIDFVKHLIGEVGEATEELSSSQWPRMALICLKTVGLFRSTIVAICSAAQIQGAALFFQLQRPSDAIVYGDSLEEYLN